MRVATATAWLLPERPQGAGPEWVRGRGLASTSSLLRVEAEPGPSQEPVGRGAENPPKDLRTWNGPPETLSRTAGGLAQPARDLQPTSFPGGRTAFRPSNAGVAPRPQPARVPGSGQRGTGTISLRAPSAPPPLLRSTPVMKLNFSLRLRVFNLNCWDIPYLSKHRADRMKRLGDFLNLESFDLALLEEVWSEQDFQYLKQRLSPAYPDAHYFRSGIIGSGLCVFSRHPIQEITQHVYALNGYPYMFYHGDWFCGKSVGLLVLRLSGLVLNAYVTHLHAEYSRQKDIYLAHRVAQAWELAQFIHHTSKNADVVLLCGDLNMHPKDLGCCLLKEWTGLRDAFVETEDFKGSDDGCTMVPKNCYVSQQDLGPFPMGIRIDYVLYKAGSGYHICCKTLKTTTGCDPHSGTPFSDHEALMATLYVKHSPPQEDPCPAHGPPERPILISLLREARTELGLAIAKARWWATFAGYVIAWGLSLLVLLCVLATGEEAREVAIIVWAPSVGLVLGAGAIYLFHKQEAKGLCRAQAEMQLVLTRETETREPGSEPPLAHCLQQEGDRADEQ